MDVESEAGLLLGEARLPHRAPLVSDAAAYLRRTRLGRRYGLVGGLVLGFGPLAGDSQVSLVLPRMLAGYVLGLLVSEWLAPRRQRLARRAADLRVRRGRDLLPGWARASVWVLFLPALASPLLVLVHPVAGLAHVRAYGYSCSAGRPQWPGVTVLATVAAIAAAGMLVTQLTLARLARRPRPADDPDGARLDDVLRGMSARAVAGGAAALALIEAAGLVDAVYNDGHTSFLCPARPGRPFPAFPWAAALPAWLQLVSLAMLAAAFVTLAVCRRRQDPRRRPVPGAA